MKKTARGKKKVTDQVSEHKDIRMDTLLTETIQMKFLRLFLIIMLCCLGFTAGGAAKSPPAEDDAPPIAGKSSDAPPKPAGPPPAAPDKGLPEMVSIDFDNVDIKVFIKFISKLTNQNFVIDSRIKGNVTVISPEKISREEAYQVFESVLDIHGYTTVKSGKVIKVLPQPNAKSDNIDTRVISGWEPLTDRLVTRIIPLEYASSDEMKRLLAPLVSKGSVALSYPDTNMLIITASLASIERLLKIVNAVDVPNIGRKISVIPVQYADAAKLVTNLTTIFTAKNRGRKKKPTDQGDQVQFVADERTNSVILLASKLETERVIKLIELLDKQIPRGDERIRVYYLEHANAEEMVEVLNQIPAQASKEKTEGKKAAPILSQKVYINADKATNSLIIMAEKEDYPVLEEVIAKLDIPRAMVYIECLLMEVNFTKGLDLGTEWKASQGFSGDSRVVFGGYGDDGYSSLGNASSEDGSTLPDGFSLGVLGKSISIGGVEFPDIQAIVEAYQTDEDVTILSTPQLLTTENEEASITVGKNVPYQTRSAAESGTETYSSYEYKDVGISLKITPQISEGRMIRLDIFQELTKLDSVNTTSDDRPTTFKRQIETAIIVEDGNSVVIGGLIDESITTTEKKAPCLGDIPTLGWAFKSVAEGEERTNLYVFITPRVVQNPLEADAIFKEKRESVEKDLQKGEVLLYHRLEEMSKKISGKDKEEDAGTE